MILKFLKFILDVVIASILAIIQYTDELVERIGWKKIISISPKQLQGRTKRELLGAAGTESTDMKSWWSTWKRNSILLFILFFMQLVYIVEITVYFAIFSPLTIFTTLFDKNSSTHKIIHPLARYLNVKRVGDLLSTFTDL